MPVFFFNFSYVSYVWFLKNLKENVRERKQRGKVQKKKKSEEK